MPVFEFECPNEACATEVFDDFHHSANNPPESAPCPECGIPSLRLTAPSNVVVGHRIGGELSHKPMGKGAEYAMRRNSKAFETASESDKERYTFPKNRNKEFDPVTPKRVY